MNFESSDRAAPGRPRYARWIFCAFAAVALFFLIGEHRAHLYGAWPYLLAALCPLLHLFHRHGGGSGSTADARRSGRRHH